MDSINKIKVLHMATIDFTIDKMLMDKMGYLRGYGYDIRFASNSGKYLNNIQNAGFRFQPIKMSREISIFKDLRSIYNTYKYLKKEKFTIVHTHTAKAGFIGRMAAKLAGTPVIIHTSHGLPFYEGQSRIKYNLYLFLEKLACRMSDFVFSQNMEDVENMKKLNFRPAAGIGYEGNGVDTHKLDKEAAAFDGDEKKRELGIPDNAVVLGYYARFEPVKGHKLFIDAFSSIVKKYGNVLCLMAGKGFLEEEIKQYAAMKNVDKNIRFLGFREDIHEIISITDILVLASEKEGIPRVVMEGMYLEKPVVATDVLGTRELVVSEETGFLCAYGDADGLAARIALLVEDRDLRIKMGKAGRERIINHFTEEIVAGRIDAVYKDLLARKGITE
ncbi:MAG: glycosyltransferase family 4 protein [Clostridiales bacterium]|jgi:glycosyltransferase involved in cell wall biosynthesis|nr:glycosyltransferase family 4 protein [Eubacteriales bacterium]MDH7565701.1 glycosyltransferase family 4 protein [Clostridiales bacterium]